jgi:pimeloyl-ACP methyl ester carboxylesterase
VVGEEQAVRQELLRARITPSRRSGGRWSSSSRRDVTDVILAGESMGATVSPTAAAELEDRVRRVVAVNLYDYRHDVGRANRLRLLRRRPPPRDRPASDSNGQQAARSARYPV